MHSTTKYGISFAALGAVGMSMMAVPGAMLMPACSSNETTGSSGGGSSGSSSGGGTTGEGGAGNYCGTAGQACCAAPGQVPNPECDDGDESTCATSIACAAASNPPAECGTFGTPSAPSCEPLANNTSTTWDFRMRRIILVAPSKLANATVQNVVVTSGVDMDEPQCAESSSSTGLFNWLVSFNSSTNTVTTGGAPACNLPSCNPYTTGYCYVNKNVDGIQVGPVSAAYTTGSDGTISTQAGAIPTLNIPIYFGSPPSIILLPIRNGALEGVKLSADHNCIGSVNPYAMDSSCSDNYQACSKWLTGGSLTGFITLKQANQVQIATTLCETLCSELTGDTGGAAQTPPSGSTCASIKSCTVDSSGNPTATGNYCSGDPSGSTVGPGGCNDSYWLAATFAASSVIINNGAGVADCSGGGTSDDAGGGTPPADSGTD